MAKNIAKIRLGINIDHVATLRNARRGKYPEVLSALNIVKNDADFVTVHLRSDRRHILDSDIVDISNDNFPINFELGMTEEIVNICLATNPKDACIVPETREEITTESGLDLQNHIVIDKINKFVPKLKQNGVRVSLFVDANFVDTNSIALNAINALLPQCRPDAIEIHTGSFCDLLEDFIYQNYPNFNYKNFEKPTLKSLFSIACSVIKRPHALFCLIADVKNTIFAANIQNFAIKLVANHHQNSNFQAILRKLNDIKLMAKLAKQSSLSVHAGHGLTYISTYFIKQIHEISEISIGHFVVSQSIFDGLSLVIKKINAILKFSLHP